ncbi:MAG: SMC family ATPase, partial [Spirochaetales bacterium]|nr:SMC family ATPase [Spirochaetales bacterium]
YDEMDSIAAAISDKQNNVRQLNAEVKQQSDRRQELANEYKWLTEQLDIAKQVTDKKYEAENLKKQNEYNLTEYQKLHNIVSDIIAVENELKLAQTQVIESDAAYKEVQNRYYELHSKFLCNQAGILADKLVDGQPCPVCGSIDHPHPAAHSEQHITEETLKAAETKAENARKASENNAKIAEKCIGRLESSNANLSAELSIFKEHNIPIPNAENADMSEIQHFCQSKIKELRSQTAQLCKEIEDYTKVTDNAASWSERRDAVQKEGESVRDRIADNNNQLSKFNTEIKCNSESLANLRSSNKYSSKQEAQSRILSLQERNRQIDEQLILARQQQEAARISLEKCKSEVQFLQSQLHTDLPPEECYKNFITQDQVLSADIAAAKQTKNSLSDELDQLNANIITNQKYLPELERLFNEWDNMSQRLSMLTSLKSTAGGTITGQQRITFESFIQQKNFHRVLLRANKRLQHMSDGQYELRVQEEGTNNKSKSGLGLNIYDYHTGKHRNVTTLSGGESFKAALSLALGLSDEIQSSAGGVEIQSMFVDEGFGSLDPQSLNLALESLKHLAGNHCLIGLISHVEALQQNIENQIVVTKDQSGRS